MTKEEMLVIEAAKSRLFTFEELRDTFLAGGRMNSNHYISWMEAFNEWVIFLEVQKDTEDGVYDVDLS